MSRAKVHELLEAIAQYLENDEYTLSRHARDRMHEREIDRGYL